MSLSVKNSCGGKSLPELTNPASASDISSGKQAIDGDGNIIDGNLYQLLEGRQWIVNGTNLEPNGIGGITTYGALDGDFIFRNGSIIGMNIESSEFGNATAADVAAGKTFTSTAGLKVTGAGAMLDTNNLSFSTGSPITVPASARLIFFRVYTPSNANRMFIVDVVNKKVYGSPGITDTSGDIKQLNTTGSNYDPSSNYDGHVTFNSDGTVKVNSAGDIQLAYI